MANRNQLLIFVFIVVLLILAPATSRGDDCNGNGLDDFQETKVTLVPNAIVVESVIEAQAGVADFDGDGDIDVAVAGLYGELYWFENQDGDGTFGPQQLVDGDAERLAIGDLDSDGDADILVTFRDLPTLEVAWFENDGDGNFGPARPIVDAPQHSDWVAVADLDGDGDNDALVTSHTQRQAFWFPNLDGRGTFGARRNIGTSVPSSISDQVTLRPATGDVDGDGHVDVLLAIDGGGNGTVRQIAWHRNTGSGSFEAGRIVTTAAWLFASAADVDGDGDQDVLSNYAWHENLDGAGNAWNDHPVVSTSNPQALAAIDLDSDGDEDLVSSDTGLYWYRNLGAGVFGQALLVDGVFSLFPAVPADIDGDGDRDFVVGSYGQVDAFWYRNRATDCNGNRVPDECDIANQTADDCDVNGVPDTCDVAVGPGTDCNQTGVLDACEIASGDSQDCAGDGVPDECEPDCNGNEIADSCDIDSGFSNDCGPNGIPDDCESDCNGNAVYDGCDIAGGGSSDCDLDGRPDDCDLAGGLAQDCDGNGVLDRCDTAFALERVDVPSMSGALAVGAGDLDGDGVNDIIIGGEFGIAWHRNTDGAGSFGPVQSIGSDFDDVTSVFIVDIDGDGDNDVLSDVCGYENLDGAGTFAPGGFPCNVEDIGDLDGDGVLDVVRPGVTGGGWNHWLRAADIDGDGDLDLVGFDDLSTPDNDFGSEIRWAENLDAQGSFGPAIAVCGPVDQGTSLDTADFDGDGDEDIVFADAELEIVAWCENLDGAGTFGPQRLIATLGTVHNPWRVVAADVDGDGDEDVLHASHSNNKIGWHRNLDGRGSFGPVLFLAEDQYRAKAIAAADLDGDGDIDPFSIAEFESDLVWFRNLGNDCNGNRFPDICDADCNLSGIADDCEIRSGASLDCDRSGTPDECDAACPGCDADGDLCPDELDCLPNDGAAWSAPGAARALLFTSGTEMTWNLPAEAGGAPLQYDALRSMSAGDFHGPADCVETDTQAQLAEDTGEPLEGDVFYYLIRAETDCGESLGATSSGAPRSGAGCP